MIGPYQVLPLRVRVDQAVMAINGYSVFPKVPELLEPHQGIVLCNIQLTQRESYSTVEKQSMYSKAVADWAKNYLYSLELQETI